MLDKNPKSRISLKFNSLVFILVREIIKHPWINEMCEQPLEKEMYSFFIWIKFALKRRIKV